MKFAALSIILGVASATSSAAGNAAPSGHPWIAPGPNDFRGPCPMLNTLANHGFLPRDGKNLTLEATVNGLAEGLNFNTSLATVMFHVATTANPTPNATFFTLDQLNVHNVLEHDGSLSRSDAFFGNNHVFNESIFEQTIQYWTDPIIDINMLANGRMARVLTSKAFNPNFTFTSTMNDFSFGEVIAPIVAFGDLDTAMVNRTLVEYFFRNERLPTELGWSKRAEAVTLDIILRLTSTLSNATTFITTGTPVVSSRDIHAGVGF
ncbi:Cloroperoxidase [Annulohypoxylon bovei var. microspora]|nr:Cloroperoxidase [Annulohypoxylon bovei var. microspora]